MPATLLLAPQARAQQIRNFPHGVVRGEITFTAPPQVLVDRREEFLAPGVRVRDARNLLALSGTLRGQTFLVNYLRDPVGLVREVWILTPEEAATRPGATTPSAPAPAAPAGPPIFLGG